MLAYLTRLYGTWVASKGAKDNSKRHKRPPTWNQGPLTSSLVNNLQNIWKQNIWTQQVISHTVYTHSRHFCSQYCCMVESHGDGGGQQGQKATKQDLPLLESTRLYSPRSFKEPGYSTHRSVHLFLLLLAGIVAQQTPFDQLTYEWGKQQVFLQIYIFEYQFFSVGDPFDLKCLGESYSQICLVSTKSDQW